MPGRGPHKPQVFIFFFVKIDRLYKSMTYSVFVTVVIEDRVCLPFCYIFFFFFFFLIKDKTRVTTMTTVTISSG